MTREEAYNYAMRACEGTWNSKTCADIRKALEQEPCEDCISRQDVLKRREILKDKQGTGYQAVKTKYIRKLPSVNPQQKTGHWIADEVQLPDRVVLNYHCSVCGRKLVGYSTETLKDAPYCHCGARMSEENK